MTRDITDVKLQEELGRKYGDQIVKYNICKPGFGYTYNEPEFDKEDGTTKYNIDIDQESDKCGFITVKVNTTHVIIEGSMSPHLFPLDPMYTGTISIPMKILDSESIFKDRILDRVSSTIKNLFTGDAYDVFTLNDLFTTMIINVMEFANTVEDLKVVCSIPEHSSHVCNPVEFDIDIIDGNTMKPTDITIDILSGCAIYVIYTVHRPDESYYYTHTESVQRDGHTDEAMATQAFIYLVELYDEYKKNKEEKYNV